MTAPRSIFLTLRGQRAPHGIEVGALDVFLQQLSAALRDFDRHQRGDALRKSGSPQAAAAAATALRIVSLKPGSALLELEATRPEADELVLPADDEPRARRVVAELARRIDSRSPLPDEVVDSLERARRAIGEDGLFTVGLRDAAGLIEATFDVASASALRYRTPDASVSVSTLHGRLSLIEEAPDRALIRTPDGVAWTVTVPEELVEALGPLWRRHVSAAGIGQRVNATRGKFTLESVALADDHLQTQLFTERHVPTTDLLQAQGATRVGPLGIEDIDVVDAADEEAYLEQLIAGDGD